MMQGPIERRCHITCRRPIWFRYRAPDFAIPTQGTTFLNCTSGGSSSSGCSRVKNIVAKPRDVAGAYRQFASKPVTVASNSKAASYEKNSLFLRKLAEKTLLGEEQSRAVARQRTNLFTNENTETKAGRRSKQWKQAMEKFGEDWGKLSQSEKRAVEKGKVLEHSFTEKYTPPPRKASDPLFPDYDAVVARQKRLDLKAQQAMLKRTSNLPSVSGATSNRHGGILGSTAREQNFSENFGRQPDRYLQTDTTNTTEEASKELDKFLISVPHGLEPLLEEELYESIFPHTPGTITHMGKGLVFVQGRCELLWNLAITARFVDHVRVLFAPILAFGEAELMRGVKGMEADWGRFLPPHFREEGQNEQENQELLSGQMKMKPNREEDKSTRLGAETNVDHLQIQVVAKCDEKSRLKDVRLVSDLVARSLPVRRVDVATIRRRVLEGEEKTSETSAEDEANQEENKPEAKRRKAAERDLQLYDRFQRHTSPDKDVTQIKVEMRHNKAHLSVYAAARPRLGCAKPCERLPPPVASACIVKCVRAMDYYRGPTELPLESSGFARETLGDQEPAFASGCRSVTGKAAKDMCPPTRILWDPFCSDGGLLLEALSVLQETPPGSPNLNYPMLRFPSHDEQKFQEFQRDLCDRIGFDPELSRPLRSLALVGSHERGVATAIDNFHGYLKRMPRTDVVAEKPNPFLGATFLGEVTTSSFSPDLRDGDPGENAELPVSAYSSKDFPDGAGGKERDGTLSGGRKLSRRRAAPSLVGGMKARSRATQLRQAVQPLHSVSFYKGKCSVEFAEELFSQKFQVPALSSSDAAERHVEIPARSRTLVPPQVTLLTHLPSGPGVSSRYALWAASAVTKILKKCSFVTDAFCLTARGDLQRASSANLDWRVQLRAQNNENGSDLQLLRWQRA
ncbi:unnamed protein product [Amoebophrya sp. A120]|nr:unnamed protein product [Amoebophrya sp. A120]|eukprot:GSA120T00011502001.1